jgi:glycosyltransferase involved in cell wall biosynthesis
MKKKKILFIAPHRRDRAPSQRFRFEQYISFLEANGFETEYSSLLNEKDDKIIYSPGKLFGKGWIFLKSFFLRRKDVKRAKDCAIVFVQREAFMTGATRFERAFKKQGAKLVYDFDDSIWLLDVSAGNKKFSWLKDPGKTSKLIAISDLVFAGNDFLASYAKKFNSNVVIVPTTIDTEEYKRIENNRVPGKIIIGWSGSLTTIKHFEFAVPFLKILKAKYKDGLEIKVIGDGTYVNEELGVKGMAWNKENEIRELSTFDIGIMPLPDDQWAKGKCGLKGLQYMALEIPTLMSPVGVNSEIVQPGVNGFLPVTTEEWVENIEKLIADPELRKKMGEAARKTVEEKYSVKVWKGKYLELFNDLLK